MPEFNEGVDVFNDFLKISGLNTKKLEAMFDNATNNTVNSSNKIVK